MKNFAVLFVLALMGGGFAAPVVSIFIVLDSVQKNLLFLVYY